MFGVVIVIISKATTITLEVISYLHTIKQWLRRWTNFGQREKIVLGWWPSGLGREGGLITRVGLGSIVPLTNKGQRKNKKFNWFPGFQSPESIMGRECQ